MKNDRLLETIRPERILENRTFETVVLDPPDLNPGSWIGAGNTLVDRENETFWMTTRWKRNSEKGFSWDSAVQLFRSPDGENVSPVRTLHRRDLAELLDDEHVRGVEGQQLLRDPDTGKFHLYLSIHREGRGWDTALLVSDHPSGTWEHRGTVLPLGTDFDALDARDPVISVIDGTYIALYKAASGQRLDGWEGSEGREQSTSKARVNMALATSDDGVSWEKHGLLRIDGEPQPRNLLLSGRIFPDDDGPVFIGMESRSMIRGTTCGDTFSAYRIDRQRMNLETVFRDRWAPLSPYEREDYPVHTYMDPVVDPFEERLLIYLEAIDPEHSLEIGIDEEVDRLLLYTVDLPHLPDHG